MSLQARAYITAVVSAGLLALAAGFYQWQSADLPRYFSYLALAVLSATLKVRLPGMTGTFSLGYLFVLVGIADLSFAETVTIGVAAAIVQCLWNTRSRPRLIRVLFNVAGISVSAAVAYSLGHFAVDGASAGNLPVLLALAGSVYFVTNTVLVSGALFLVETKPLAEAWQNWLLSSFPCYLVGTTSAGLISVSSRLFGWQSSLLPAPLMFLVFYHYHLYSRTRTAAP